MDPEYSKVTAYPVSLIPGQYQEYYRKSVAPFFFSFFFFFPPHFISPATLDSLCFLHCRYKPNELKYFPLNTAIYGPPKRIVNPLVKVTSAESDEDMNDSQEVKMFLKSPILQDSSLFSLACQYCHNIYL